MGCARVLLRLVLCFMVVVVLVESTREVPVVGETTDDDMESAVEFVENLLKPQTIESFLSTYFEKEPFLTRRKGSPDYFHELFSLEDIDHVLSNFLISEGGLVRTGDNDWTLTKRIWKEGRGWASQSLGPHVYLSLASVHEHIARRDYTLVLNKAHVHHVGLGFVVKQLNRALGETVSANVYITSQKQGNQGFAAHLDWMDAIIVQVSGCKRWRVYDNLWDETQLPRPDMKKSLSLHEPPSIIARLAELPFSEFDLSAGSLLTLPRGTIHEASANCSDNGPYSIHVTLGIESALASSAEALLLQYLHLQDPPASLTLTSDSGDVSFFAASSAAVVSLCVHFAASATKDPVSQDLRRSLRPGLLWVARGTSLTPKEVDMLASFAQAVARHVDVEQLLSLGLELGVFISLSNSCIAGTQSASKRNRSSTLAYLLPYLSLSPSHLAVVKEEEKAGTACRSLHWTLAKARIREEVQKYLGSLDVNLMQQVVDYMRHRDASH